VVDKAKEDYGEEVQKEETFETGFVQAQWMRLIPFFYYVTFILSFDQRAIKTDSVEIKQGP
jgi:hypothetical protein